MDVVWLNRFKLNRFETGLSGSVNGAYVSMFIYTKPNALMHFIDLLVGLESVR